MLKCNFLFSPFLFVFHFISFCNVLATLYGFSVETRIEILVQNWCFVKTSCETIVFNVADRITTIYIKTIHNKKAYSLPNNFLVVISCNYANNKVPIPIASTTGSPLLTTCPQNSSHCSVPMIDHMMQSGCSGSQLMIITLQWASCNCPCQLPQAKSMRKSLGQDHTP